MTPEAQAVKARNKLWSKLPCERCVLLTRMTRLESSGDFSTNHFESNNASPCYGHLSTHREKVVNYSHMKCYKGCRKAQLLCRQRSGPKKHRSHQVTLTCWWDSDKEIFKQSFTGSIPSYEPENSNMPLILMESTQILNINYAFE